MKDSLFSEHFSISGQGHLTLDGLDLVAAAQEFGTPAYVISEAAVRQQCRAYMQAMKRVFGENFKVSYASKALCARFIYPIIQSEGLHADVVSGGELYTALKAGFPASNLHFHGNNKSDAELRQAVECGIGAVVIDCLDEIERLNAICVEKERQMPVLLRVKPGVDAHTHEFISTGHNDCKFGFGIEDGQVYEAARLLRACRGLDFCGLHCHIGSQVFLKEPFGVAADVMIRLLAELRRDGYNLRELILGGGFGVKYMPEDKPVPVSEMVEYLGKAVRESCQKYDTPVPEIVIEPGRSIVSAAGVTLYTVGSVKPVPGARTYVAIDGGMPDNPRFALYQACYDACIANKAAQAKTDVVTIAGKCCESGDLLGRDMKLQPAQRGDVLCVFSTGAYTYSMASNYNRLPRPPIVLVSGGRGRVVVRRESYEDLVRNDLQ